MGTEGGKNTANMKSGETQTGESLRIISQQISKMIINEIIQTGARIYGEPDLTKRHETWDLIRTLKDRSEIP